MVIIYQSKTGFTRKYAEMLAEKTGMKAFPVSDLKKINREEEVLFLGWIKAGQIQGLKKLGGYQVQVVCASGTGRTAEPDPETVIARNNIAGIPFFYLRGGCFPLKQLKGLDRILLAMFVHMLKNRPDKDEKTEEVIHIVENGFDGVKEENLEPVLAWLRAR